VLTLLVSGRHDECTPGPPGGLALVSTDAPTGNNQLAGTPATAGAFTMKLTGGHAIRLERTAGERAFDRQNYPAGSWQSSACGSISMRSEQLLHLACTQPCLSWRQGIEIPPGLPWTSVAVDKRAAKPRWHMPAPVLCRTPLSVSEGRVLLCFSDAQAGLRQPRREAPIQPRRLPRGLLRRLLGRHRHRPDPQRRPRRPVTPRPAPGPNRVPDGRPGRFDPGVDGRPAHRLTGRSGLDSCRGGKWAVGVRGGAPGVGHWNRRMYPVGDRPVPTHRIAARPDVQSSNELPSCSSAPRQSDSRCPAA